MCEDGKREETDRPWKTARHRNIKRGGGGGETDRPWKTARHRNIKRGRRQTGHGRQLDTET